MNRRLAFRLVKFSALAALVAWAGRLPALTVLPTDFNQLVDQADAIFQGEVLSVRSDWTGLEANRHIATYVQFRVVRVFKGSAPNPQTLEIFGGTVGARSMTVPGMPKFEVGQMELLFVRNNGREFCPLVGVSQGRFHVKRDSAGAERVFLHDGTVLSDPLRLATRRRRPPPRLLPARRRQG